MSISSGISYIFDSTDVQAFIQSASGTPYQLTISETGILRTNLSGTSSDTPLPYLNLSGGSITGTLNALVISGTTISGGSVYSNGVLLTNYTLPSSLTGLTLVASNVISGTTISGNSLWLSGTQFSPSNYQPVGNYVVSGSSNILNVLNANVISGTTISGLNIYQNGSQVINSGIGAGGISVTKSNGILTVSGNFVSKAGDTMTGGLFAPSIDTATGQLLIGQTNTGNTNIYAATTVTIQSQKTILVNAISGITINSASDITVQAPIIHNAGDTDTHAIYPIANNTYDLGQAGLQYTNAYANSIYQNGSQVIDSGIGVGNVTVTKSGGILTISGSSSGASSSGTNLGTGFAVFNSLSGNNLQFNSISGVGSLVNGVSVVNNTIIISGSTSAGTGDVVGPSSSITNSVPTYADTSGKLLKDGTGVIISPSGTLNATVVSGTTISGSTLSINGKVFYPPTIAEINFGSLPINSTSFTLTDDRVTTNSLVDVKSVSVATSGRTTDDYYWDNIKFTAGAKAGSITVYASTDTNTTVLGTRKIQYTIY